MTALCWGRGQGATRSCIAGSAYGRCWRRVVCTTTTKIFPPEIPSVIFGRRPIPLPPSMMLSAAPCCGCWHRCRMREAGRYPPYAESASYLAAAARRPFLVEVDGASVAPVAPLRMNPSCRSLGSSQVAVVGLDSVGSRWIDGHVHRSGTGFEAAAGQKPGSPASPATLFVRWSTPKVVLQLSGGARRLCAPPIRGRNGGA